jgi:cyclic beta-1,2-glucan synthetase
MAAPGCRRRTGSRNRCRSSASWKILDNLRRSLLAPALLALFVAAWTVLPGSPWPGPWAASGARAGPPPSAGRGEDLGTAFAQSLLTLVFLPFHAWEMVHAIGLTLVTLRHAAHLLEWETAAVQGERPPAT